MKLTIKWEFSDVGEMLVCRNEEYRDFIWDMIHEALNGCVKNGYLMNDLPCSLEIAGETIKLSVSAPFFPPANPTNVFRKMPNADFGIAPAFFSKKEEE